MRLRLSFILITTFWVVMMALLYRAEIIGRRQPGGNVPAAMVWQRILTAPDNSSLEIRMGTNRIGFCRWSANIGEEFKTGVANDYEAPEGMIKQLSSYSLDLDGNLNLADLALRSRFNFHLILSTNLSWQSFQLRLNMRPDIYELSGDAQRREIVWHAENGEGDSQRTIRFAELQNPRSLLAELGGPLLPGILGSVGLPMGTNALEKLSLGLRWEARNDWLQVGRTRMRVYRLHTLLLDRYAITVHVSPVGEILRAELPNRIILINEALLGPNGPRS